jgi:hypothetical protein
LSAFNLNACPQAAGLLLFVSATMVLLAFIPLTPPVDAIKGGGLTARGMIEFGLVLGRNIADGGLCQIEEPALVRS